MRARPVEAVLLLLLLLEAVPGGARDGLGGGGAFGGVPGIAFDGAFWGASTLLEAVASVFFLSGRGSSFFTCGRR